jgi:hypothetical protein
MEGRRIVPLGRLHSFFLIFFGLALVPITSAGILPSVVNTENIVMGLFLVMLPFYGFVVRYDSLKINVFSAIASIGLVGWSFLISTLSPNAATDFFRLSINFLLAWLSVVFLIKPFQEKGISLSKYFSYSLIFLTALYLSIFVFRDGLIITKLYSSAVGYNVNAYMNLFNLALLLVVFLRICERMSPSASNAIGKKDEYLLQFLVLIILAICVVQQLR